MRRPASERELSPTAQTLPVAALALVILAEHLALNVLELAAERPAHPQFAPFGAQVRHIAVDLASECAGRLGC